MTELGKSKSDFEKVIDKSYDLAVSLHHEYVIVEHVLCALLEFDEIKKLFTALGADVTALRDTIREFLADPQYHSIVNEKSYQPKYTTTLMTVIRQAKAQSLFLGRPLLSVTDLLMSLFNLENSYALYFLHQHRITKDSVTEYLTQKTQTGPNQEIDTEDALAVLGQYAVNLNLKAQQNRVNPLIGREADVELLVETVARKLKNNVLLVGHPGVG